LKVGLFLHKGKEQEQTGLRRKKKAELPRYRPTQRTAIGHDKQRLAWPLRATSRRSRRCCVGNNEGKSDADKERSKRRRTDKLLDRGHKDDWSSFQTGTQDSTVRPDGLLLETVKAAGPIVSEIKVEKIEEE